MKRTLILSTATALVLGLSGIAWAGTSAEVDCNVNGNANWSNEKLAKQIANRNSNAGIGNRGEDTSFYFVPNGDMGSVCFAGLISDLNDEPASRDDDPGNSYAHNANNRKNK